jgi:hypothetical protein
MGHGHNGLIAGDALMMGMYIFAFIVVIAGIIWLIHRKSVASDGLTPIERKNMEYPECEILSMLRQHGGPMMQREIIDSLPGDPEDLAGVMKHMETSGWIQREWRSEQGTFMVSV